MCGRHRRKGSGDSGRTYKLAAVLLALSLVAAGAGPAHAHHEEFVDKVGRGQLWRVSVSSQGEQADGGSGWGCGTGFSASDDGRYVAFASEAGNLHPSDVNGKAIQDVFVFDRKKGRIELVSALPSGLAPTLPVTPSLKVTLCGSHAPAISGNGRFVAFVSPLPLIRPGDPEAATLFNKVYIRDLKKDTTELVSRTYDGTPALSDSGPATVSDNGRYVAFGTRAPNIVKDACSTWEVVPGVESPYQPFSECAPAVVRDRAKGETVLVSRSSDGRAANHGTSNVGISGNGRYVVFQSAADNLVRDDGGDPSISSLLGGHCPARGPSGPSCTDVFIHDLKTRQTELVSQSRDGGPANDASYPARLGQSLSDDGRYVLFESWASDIVPQKPSLTSWGGGPLGGSRSYVKDRKTGRTERVSVTSAGSMFTAVSNPAGISDDGRYVIFAGESCEGCPPSTSLNGDDGHGYGGHFIHDRRTGQTDRVLHKRMIYPEKEVPSGTRLMSAVVGGDARFLVGIVDLNGTVKGDTNDAYDVFVRDLPTPEVGTSFVGAASRDSARSGAFRGTAAVVGQGGNLVAARVVHRPDRRDLYVRLDVDRLGDVEPLTGSPYQLYGLRFTVGNRDYEVRTQGSPGQLLGGGLFGLFDCTATCDHVTQLDGSYGTVGESVVVELPLAEVGLDGDTGLSRVSAYTALGSFASGARKMLAEMRLARQKGE